MKQPWTSPRCTPIHWSQASIQSGPSEENPNLAPLSFSPFLWARRLPVHVTCCIPAYAHMRVGDAITVRWGDARFDLPPLQRHDLGASLLASVPTSVVEPVCEGDHLELSYCIIAASGRRSGWATPCVLKARRAGADALYVYAGG
jgi:hypothetical protein